MSKYQYLYFEEGRTFKRKCRGGGEGGGWKKAKAVFMSFVYWWWWVAVVERPKASQGI